MKILLTALLLAATPLHAQTLATVSGTAMSADEAAFVAAGAAEIQASIPSALSDGPLSGRLDFSPNAALGAWQSIKSVDQAIGISKRVFHLDKGSQPLLNIGLFVGGSKPLLSDPGASARFLVGPTFAVPGSTLDWALGTTWGQQWVPKLKTGVLAAYDFTRPKALKAVPDFVGLGAAWPFGGL